MLCGAYVCHLAASLPQGSNHVLLPEDDKYQLTGKLLRNGSRALYLSAFQSQPLSERKHMAESLVSNAAMETPGCVELCMHTAKSFLAVCMRSVQGRSAAH